MVLRPRSAGPALRSGGLPFDDTRQTPPPRDVYTVSRLNREAKALIEGGLPLVVLEAEISNLVQHASGHWYFSLKDEHAQVRCAMFRGANQRVKGPVRSGQKVLVRARVSLYEARGEFQLVVEALEDAGEGALRRRYEELKARLDAEGLFAATRKRPLPRLPRRIGVVTSPSGAALRDILHVLARRFPAVPVLIYPSGVQGAAAAGELTEAVVLAARRAEVDVLIVARGGGSLEDLWAFNDEGLARAIAACPMPVVSGVGHEIDYTIADLVADVRAPTPSGAAELVVPDRREWIRALSGAELRLAEALARKLRLAGDRLRGLEGRLARQHPGLKLTARAQRVDELAVRAMHALGRGLERRQARLGTLAARLERHSPAAALAQRRHALDALRARLAVASGARLARARARFEVLARALSTVSPLATLGRGYAILRTPAGAVVTDASTVATGAHLSATLAQGSLEVAVIGADARPRSGGTGSA